MTDVNTISAKFDSPSPVHISFNPPPPPPTEITPRSTWWMVGLRTLRAVYRVGQIKRGQLTFLLVTSEPIYKIKWFLAGIKYIKQQVT